MTNYQLPNQAPDSLTEIEVVNFLLPDAISILENDFHTSGIELNLSGKIFGDVFDLRGILAAEIQKTGGPASEKFFRLLYRIDIPEAKVRAILASEPERPFEELMAEMIIIRELQKAFYRKKFQ